MDGKGLDFERPILELEEKIAELKSFTSDESIDFTAEISRMEKRLREIEREIFEKLTPWQRVQVARHPNRPHTLDYIKLIMKDFLELHGDRSFGDDRAIVGGLGKIDGWNVVVVGHQKGRNTRESLQRNFGCAHPEGYRKALRLMKLAEKFDLAVVSFVDTPGAYPGIGAEERGQAEAIAYNLREMALLSIPIVVIVIGEGGSGGALGIGLGDRILILENAYYSVISPEGCAAILWKDRSMAPEAASALKLTAHDLQGLGVVDEVVPEPLGGAHRGHEEMAKVIKEAIIRHLKELSSWSVERLLRERYEKFRRMGVFE